MKVQLDVAWTSVQFVRLHLRGYSNKTKHSSAGFTIFIVPGDTVSE